MPSVQMVPGSTVDVSATTTGPTSATGALASFLVAAILRAKKMTFKPTMTREHTAADLTWSGSRIPVNELDKLPISAEATQYQNTRSRILSIRSKTRRPTDVRSLSDDNSIPQRLTDSTVPIVHDRLPDPKLWEKLNFGTEVEVDDDTLTDLSPQTEEDSSYSLPESSSTHKITKRSISAGLEGIMRRRQLYCRNGYHLQILPSGQVMGTRKDHSRYAILEFVSVNVGVVTIRGVETGLYLAMDSKGRLYGSEKLSRNCLFKETFEENKYNTYSSLRHRNHSDTRSCFVAISQQGRARSGCRSKESQKFTHFLPRLVDPRRVPWHYEGEMY